MRTAKLLLTAAALSAVGIFSAGAQTVYSQNVVGYYKVSVPAGFSMIANQLDNGSGNMLSDVIGTNMPSGTTFFKFDPSTGFQASSFVFGSWSPDLSLNPGEGAFVSAPSATTVTFVGQVMGGSSTNSIPAGLSIRSSVLPISTNLDSTAMNFPAGNGDTVFFFRNGGYESHSYVFGAFSPAAVPNVGEAFFVSKVNAADWTQTFAVGQ